MESLEHCHVSDRKRSYRGLLHATNVLGEGLEILAFEHTKMSGQSVQEADAEIKKIAAPHRGVVVAHHRGVQLRVSSHVVAAPQPLYPQCRGERLFWASSRYASQAVARYSLPTRYCSSFIPIGRSSEPWKPKLARSQ